MPDPDSIPAIDVKFHTDPEGFEGYKHDEKTFARPWAIPGTPGLEHRIGGLEKWDVTGNISYDPANHQHMSELRAAKIESMVVPDLKLDGPESGDLLIVSWGGTYGSVLTAAKEVRETDGATVSVGHLRYLNPFPKNLEAVMGRFKKILVPELNLGQLNFLLRAKFLVETVSYPKIQGRPFQVGELTSKIREILGDTNG
jgi:2-oxoglutarate ferredoxin oxidoreductase subunit alpha